MRAILGVAKEASPLADVVQIMIKSGLPSDRFDILQDDFINGHEIAACPRCISVF